MAAEARVAVTGQARDDWLGKPAEPRLGAPGDRSVTRLVTRLVTGPVAAGDSGPVRVCRCESMSAVEQT